MSDDDEMKINNARNASDISPRDFLLILKEVWLVSCLGA